MEDPMFKRLRIILIEIMIEHPEIPNAFQALDFSKELNNG